MNDLAEHLAALDADFSGSNSPTYASRRPRDTLEQARAKVAENIDANIAEFQGNAPTRTPNTLIRKLPNGKYEIGAKYGNTWLKNWISTGNNVLTFVQVKREAVVPTLTLLKAQVLSTYADEELDQIMAKNIAIHQSKKSKGA